MSKAQVERIFKTVEDAERHHGRFWSDTVCDVVTCDGGFKLCTARFLGRLCLHEDRWWRPYMNDENARWVKSLS